MGFDFKALLTAEPDATDRAAVTDQMWADLGRRVYENVMDEKFIRALVEAQLSSFSPLPKGEHPNQHTARKIRAYIFSGTITR